MFGDLYKSKKERNAERQKRLFSKTPPIELDEWFVYLVDGEKWYFKFAQNDNDFKGHKEVKFLGIGRPGFDGEYLHKPNGASNRGICCYCGCRLGKDNYSREHVIPRHKGGRIIRPCCKECNMEKGGLMLHSYIQMLNLQMADLEPNTLEYQKTAVKIANANRLAIEIEQRQI